MENGIPMRHMGAMLRHRMGISAPQKKHARVSEEFSQQAREAKASKEQRRKDRRLAMRDKGAFVSYRDVQYNPDSMQAWLDGPNDDVTPEAISQLQSEADEAESRVVTVQDDEEPAKVNNDTGLFLRATKRRLESGKDWRNV